MDDAILTSFVVALDVWWGIFKPTVSLLCSKSSLDKLLVQVRHWFILHLAHHHPSMQSAPGSGSHLAQTCQFHFVVGSDQDQTTFPPQMNHCRIHLWPNRDHYFPYGVSLQLFWYTPKNNCCVLICLNELHQGGKQTIVQFSNTKQHRFYKAFKCMLNLLDLEFWKISLLCHGHLSNDNTVQ